MLSLRVDEDDFVRLDALAAGVLFVPAPAAVQTQIGMLSGAVVARYKPARRFDVAVSTPQDKGEWFEDRGTHADITPSASRLVPSDAIVILFVVDAMRADMLCGGGPIPWHAPGWLTGPGARRSRHHRAYR
jgi:hypothetical protein